MEVDPYLMVYVGHSLVPVFGQMAQMEKLRMSLPAAGVTRLDTGVVQMHDVYREIRLTHIDIEKALEHSGLKKMMRDHGFLSGHSAAATATGQGDPTYYDTMIAGNS